MLTICAISDQLFRQVEQLTQLAASCEARTMQMEVGTPEGLESLLVIQIVILFSVVPSPL